MPPCHFLVIAIDGLRASALGSYGNTTFPTPALDKFAAQSFVLDECYAPSPELAAICRAAWQSVYPARLAVGHEVASLPRLFSEAGYHATLVTDEPSLISFVDASAFAEFVQVSNSDNETALKHRPTEIGDTALAHFFAAAGEVIDRQESHHPRLIWIHARGMYGLWDAPLDLQELLLDEEDPSPLEVATPPNLMVNPIEDPDLAFRYSTAYAAQVMVLDACWQGLQRIIDSPPMEQSWLVMLLGVRGYSLGEHGYIGGADMRLYNETLHVPWIVRFPAGHARLVRCHRLVSHLDILPTLIECANPVRGRKLSHDGRSILALANSSRASWNDMHLAVGPDGQRAIRTADWCLRADTSSEDAPELYVRPDDRWETNNVAKLLPEVVKSLSDNAVEALRLLA